MEIFDKIHKIFNMVDKTFFNKDENFYFYFLHALETITFFVCWTNIVYFYYISVYCLLLFYYGESNMGRKRKEIIDLKESSIRVKKSKLIRA